MNSTQRQRAIGIFSQRANMVAALQELKNSNFSMENIAVIAKDTSQKEEMLGATLGNAFNDNFRTKTDPITNTLVSLHIPRKQAQSYNNSINNGSYLVTIEGTESEINSVETILERHQVKEWDIYELLFERPEVIEIEHHQSK